MRCKSNIIIAGEVNLCIGQVAPTAPARGQRQAGEWQQLQQKDFLFSPAMRIQKAACSAGESEIRLKPAFCTMHMPQCKTRQQNQPRQALKQDSRSTKNGQGREPCRRTAQTNGVTMLIITPCAHVKALRPVPPAERALSAATAARACARLAEAISMEVL